MAHIKKGAIGQVLFTMVDKTDAFSVESGLTSNFTVSLFGVNHGAVAAASDITVSRAVSVVKSGIYKVELKTTETQWDMLALKITHASAADNLMIFETVDNNEASQIILLASAVSDIEVAIDSQAVLARSDASAVLAEAVSITSVLSDHHSTVVSQFAVVSNYLSDASAVLSDHVSNFGSRITELIANDSDLSNFHSDLRSMISGVGGGTASNIASVVWATAQTANQGAGTFGSLAVNIHADVADVSAILSDFKSNLESRVPELVANDSDLSQMHSDLRSMISGVGGGTASNIASVVWATAQTANQAAGTFGSLAVNVHADLADLSGIVSDHFSTAGSQFAVVSNYLSNASNYLSDISAQISDARSTMDSQFAVTSNYLSNISAQVSDTHSTMGSQFAVTSNYLSNISAQVSDMRSNMDSQFAATSNMQSGISAAISDIESQLDLVPTQSQLRVTLGVESDDTIAELSVGVPAATPKLGPGLMAMYMALRNKVEVNISTASDFMLIYNNAGSVIFKKELTDATSVYSEAQAQTGP